MKVFISLILSVFIVVFGATGCSSPVATESSYLQVPTVFEQQYVIDDYLEIEELFIMELIDNGMGSYRVYDASELTEDILENRNDTTIIERCIGMVISEQGDGIILNPNDPERSYINYRNCGQLIRNGTILASYMVYNPNTNYVDDIIERQDFVVCKDYEREVLQYVGG